MGHHSPSQPRPHGRQASGLPADRAGVLLAVAAADLRERLERLLGPHYDVTAAPDGAATPRDAQLSPDLVIIAADAPGPDRLAPLHARRADPRRRDVAVIVLAGGDDGDAGVEALEAGADDCLSLP